MSINRGMDKEDVVHKWTLVQSTVLCTLSLCVGVCMCVVLCNFITCVDSHNLHHNQDTEQLHRHKDLCVIPL